MSLSNWSVTRKVGIVLLLPVLLASIFAVVRINDDLRTIAKLRASTEQVAIVRPMLGFASATEQLGITAATDRDATNPDPATTDKAMARFDQAAADLDTALRSSKADSRVTTELTAALATARAMRGNLRSSAPATIAKQGDTVAEHVGNAIAVSPSAEDIGRIFLQVGTTMAARRLLTQEFALAVAIDSVPGARAQLLTALGAEMMMVNQYGQLEPSAAIDTDKLLTAVQTRIAAFGQNPIEPAALLPAMASLQTSLDTYHEVDAHLVDSIDSRLSTQTNSARSTVLRDVAVVVSLLLAGLATALAVARSLVVPVRRLRHGALQVAHVDLPDELEVVRAGGDIPEITPIDVHTTEEIGQLARSVDDIHRVALQLAGEQAQLRVQISNMFETLSRRSQSLVEQQLSLIEDLERDEDDSDRLQSLFRLDHLATRMRRNGDNLLVLAGTALRRGHLPPVPLSDMLWSAVSQVEDYQRVEIGSVPDGIVAGEPAVDIEHLLAELIDNSLRYSPPSTPVAVSVARAVDGGYLIEITDRGLGMSVEDLRGINERLASGGEVTIETARRMGLFVVGKLAKRHTITVSLRRTSTMAQQPGITASVHLPGTLVSPVRETQTGPQPITTTFTPAVAELPAGFSAPALTAVPNAPEPSRFGTTSTGLPQRRPVVVQPALPRLGAVARLTSLDSDRNDAGRADRPFAAAEPERPQTPAQDPASVLDLWQESPRPAESVTDLWAETAFTAPSQPPANLDRPAHREPPLTGTPVRREPGAATLAPPRSATDLRPVTAEGPTPIYQRMVSEWLVEPSSSGPASAWSSPADEGWAAAADAGNPTSSGRTSGGLPIRQPGAQLVPGGLAPDDDSGARSPEEIRSNLARHLSGVRSGRADARSNDGAQYSNRDQYNDGGIA
jgi:signal transduction histidine kinase